MCYLEWIILNAFPHGQDPSVKNYKIIFPAYGRHLCGAKCPPCQGECHHGCMLMGQCPVNSSLRDVQKKTKTRWTKISNKKQFSLSDLQVSFAMSIKLLNLTNKIQLTFQCRYNTNYLLFMWNAHLWGFVWYLRGFCSLLLLQIFT